MQVRNISPSSQNIYRKNNIQKNPQSFKARVIIDRQSFMKCKQNGYKMWNIAANLEEKVKYLSDDFEITFRGVREKFNSIFEYLYLAPKEGMTVELRYLLPVEKIKQMILDIEAENPFLYKRQIRDLTNNEPATMRILQKPTESVMVLSKTRDPKEVITPEETKEFQEKVYNKILKMIDEMPDRLINFQRYPKVL